MPDISYENFDLLIERSEHGYRARARWGEREPKRDFALDEPRPVMSTLVGLARGAPARGAPAPPGSLLPTLGSLTELGSRLYADLFDDEVRDALKTALDRAVGPSSGLRIRLHVDAPELVGVAWEILFDPSMERFPALSEKTPVVRYLDLSEPRDPLPVIEPLRVLVAISNPRGVPELEVEKEWEKLNGALRGLVVEGKVALVRLTPATIPELRSRLLNEEFHVFHFIGHGTFDSTQQEGALLFEDEEQGLRLIKGRDLGTYFSDHFPLRLAVLNSCQGGVASEQDPFTGVAQRLVQQGTPAVIAMQCAISDRAAITFSEGFYQALAAGRPLEAAVAVGRKAILTDVSEVEWATPVLYSRLPHGSLFQIDELTPEQRALLDEQSVLEDLWNPTRAPTVSLFIGKRDAGPSETGEVEPVVGLPYAMMLGEIRQFLARLYEHVIVTDDQEAVDAQGALVLLGGPVINPLVAELVEETPMPLWFLGLPYTAGQERAIGSDVDVYKPALTDGNLTSDVGLASRVLAPGTPPKFLIAGCYGAATLGVARLLMSADAVRTFGAVRDIPRFEVVARSHLAGWDVAESEVLATKTW